MTSILETTLNAITPAGDTLAPDIQAHLDDLTKPQGSLGRLEELARAYGLMRNTVTPAFGKKQIFCFAGDHGVADEGVSAFPREVTPQMVANMTSGGAAINVLSRHVGADLQVVDMGVAADLRALPGLLHRKVRAGTDNIAKGPAMTAAEAQQALETGIALATQADSDGVTLLGTGEMGIANTTPSAALFCAFLKCMPQDIVGRGTGLEDAGVQHKVTVVEKALRVNADRLTDPLTILAALGGFEIAGIAGLVLGAAARRVPVVIDGFISTAGAMVACNMHPAARDYLFFSHLSQERGHRRVMQALGARPILDLDMRLGEGTGAALAMSIIEASVKIYNEMATFSSAGVSGGE